MNHETNPVMREEGAQCAGGSSPPPHLAIRPAYERPQLTRVGSLRDLLAGFSGTVPDGESGRFRRGLTP